MGLRCHEHLVDQLGAVAREKWHVSELALLTAAVRVKRAARRSNHSHHIGLTSFYAGDEPPFGALEPMLQRATQTVEHGVRHQPVAAFLERLDSPSQIIAQRSKVAIGSRRKMRARDLTIHGMRIGQRLGIEVEAVENYLYARL